MWLGTWKFVRLEPTKRSGETRAMNETFSLPFKYQLIVGLARKSGRTTWFVDNRPPRRAGGAKNEKNDWWWWWLVVEVIYSWSSLEGPAASAKFSRSLLQTLPFLCIYSFPKIREPGIVTEKTHTTGKGSARGCDVCEGILI